MTAAPPRPLWQGRTLAVVGIVLFAFSLRSAVASLSPVVDYVGADFPLPAAVLGLIGTAPPVCYAVLGLLTPLLERKLGLEALAAIAMALTAVGLGARGLVGDSLGLLAATAVVFAAVGVGNVVLPPLVKRYFPDRVGLMTTVYTTMMAVATFLPPLVAVPVAESAGWRVSLSAWALFAVVAVVPWAVLLVRERSAQPDVETVTPRAFGRMWRLPTAWALMVGFTVSGTIAYTTFAWLPVILVDVAGLAPAAAGVLLSLFAILGMPCALIVPVLVVRRNAVRLVFGIGIGAGLIGLTGLLLAPALAPLWVAVYGFTNVLFPLILVLLGVRSRTSEGAVALSGFVQSIGYAIVAVFPVGLGILHDATGSWTAPLIVVIAVVAAAIPVVAIAARPRTVEDEWARRHGAW